MPYISQGQTNISTYNDVAGNPHNVFNSFVGLSTFHGFASLPNAQAPAIEPFREIWMLLLEAQTVFSPVPETLPGNETTDGMNMVLTSNLQLIARVGRDIQGIRVREDDNRRGEEVLTSVETKEWLDTIQQFINEVRRHKSALEATIIGPIWRRVLWSTVLSLNSDFDIRHVVLQAKDSLSHLAKELERKHEYFMMDNTSSQLHPAFETSAFISDVDGSDDDDGTPQAHADGGGANASRETLDSERGIIINSPQVTRTMT